MTYRSKYNILSYIITTMLRRRRRRRRQRWKSEEKNRNTEKEGRAKKGWERSKSSVYIQKKGDERKSGAIRMMPFIHI